MNSEVLNILKTWLANPTEHPKFLPRHGICRNVVGVLDRESYATIELVERRLDQFITEWPKFSGSKSFPVPAPDGFTPAEIDRWRTPEDAAYRHLPLWEGEYSQLRLELCAFLLEKLNELHD